MSPVGVPVMLVFALRRRLALIVIRNSGRNCAKVVSL